MGHRIMLGMAVVITAAWASAQARADSWGYGIGDDNKIYQINVNNGNVDASWTTGRSGNSNSLARDTVNNRLIFRSPETGGSLYAFDLTSPSNGGATLIAGTENLPSPSASAAFYNGSYWYVQNNTNNLVRVDFNGDGTFNSVHETVLNPNSSNPNSPSYGFGDIVITNTGLLYGSTGNRFFSVQIQADGTTSDFTSRSVSAWTNLQLTLGTDGVLYGYQHDNSTPNATDKGWFSINTTPGLSFGDRTYLGYKTNASPLRDLSDTTIPTPEPSTLAICGLGGLAMAWRLRRRKAA